MLLVFAVAVQRCGAGVASEAPSLFLLATVTWCTAWSAGEQYRLEKQKPLGARSPRGIVFPVLGDESRAPKGSFLYCHTMPRLTKQISEKYFRSQRITKRDSGRSARMGDLNPTSHICSRHTLAFACAFDCALQPGSAQFYSLHPILRLLNAPTALDVPQLV